MQSIIELNLCRQPSQNTTQWMKSGISFSSHPLFCQPAYFCMTKDAKLQNIFRHINTINTKIHTWYNIGWTAFLVWPLWWSFADVSQQGVDFSKKISKITIIFWFDFHRCSHGPSKIRRHFRNKSRSILKLSKNVFYKKCGPRLIFFNEIFF